MRDATLLKMYTRQFVIRIDNCPWHLYLALRVSPKKLFLPGARYPIKITDYPTPNQNELKYSAYVPFTIARVKEVRSSASSNSICDSSIKN